MGVRSDRKSAAAGSVSPRYVPGGVYLLTRVHIPNILKEKDNLKKVIYG
jgi:hypothetical protein